MQLMRSMKTCPSCGKPPSSEAPPTAPFSYTKSSAGAQTFQSSDYHSAASQPSAGPSYTAFSVSSSAPAYAGFWLRVGAYLLDSLIVGVLGFIFSIIIGGVIGGILGSAELSGNIDAAIQSPGFEFVVNLSSVIIGWLYFSLQESSKVQATLGKRALGCKVTDLAGNRISFGRATARYFSKIVSALILCIGFIMIAFNPMKQGLHDKMADTLVVMA